MRQAGIIAAAGVYVLEHHVERLAEDHENARLLAEGLAAIEPVQVDPGAVQTNMVFARVDAEVQPALLAHLADHDVVMRGGDPMRLVTHLDVDAQGVQRAVDSAREFFERRG